MDLGKLRFCRDRRFTRLIRIVDGRLFSPAVCTDRASMTVLVVRCDLPTDRRRGEVEFLQGPPPD